VTAYFFDSSAIVKRYVVEPGTKWVRRLTRRGKPEPIYLVRITTVEVTSAVARRRQGGSLTVAKASSILSRFRHHVAGRYLMVEVTPVLLADAARLANLHVLRAYDAVQLAAAMEVNRRWQAAGLGSVTLVSADKALNDAALAEGMTVEDPRSYP
jgi:predicted nucleic acid-binding protein